MNQYKKQSPEYFWIDGHRMHVFRAGDENKPKLVFMAGSGTAAPVYDYKVFYHKNSENTPILCR